VKECVSITEWQFFFSLIDASDAHLREIDGFNKWTSFCRFDIPSLIETIRFSGFVKFTSLNEIGVFLHQTVIWKRLMDLINGYHFIKLKFFHPDFLHLCKLTWKKVDAWLISILKK
jgi:hypothetical protein